MTMPFYASVEQVMRDRSELARKGIARGRGVVVLSYSRGVLFVAENLSTALHKVSEIYDRIGFAAVGRYNEYENLRQAGIRHADVRGYSYDRRDVTGRALANAYAQTLGTIFSEQHKPFEVELCVAEVGANPDSDQLYHLTYDGSIGDEPDFVVMGGQADVISTALKESFRQEMDTAEAVAAAVAALSSVSTSVNGAGTRTLGVGQLEVAVLDRSRPRRAFRRITGAALTALLSSTDIPTAEAAPTEDAGATPAESPTEGDGADGEPGTGL
ncbi:MAG: proteasome alpha subunit [Pseudonocardiales bacterium]|nr:prcA [Pseudonocardiales bacterium]MDT7718871.1 proteasome alpha subunit [Pseudonocardiales bacterium]